MYLPVIIEQDEQGYYAECPVLDGCFSQGQTYEETLRNIEDAVKLHIEDRVMETQGLNLKKKFINLTNIFIDEKKLGVKSFQE